MVGCCEYHSGRKGEGEAPRGAAYGWAALYIRANLCGVHCPSSPWGVNPLPTILLLVAVAEQAGRGHGWCRGFRGSACRPVIFAGDCFWTLGGRTK
ncbi:hypothetical protein LCGC14_0993680 [marine sediment metagenome]|uniref:Uncharacterized protein n=1 Tax=marine sediment metagenome TaxID=412755 RepID=A0A0F9N519_9ZZZZ